MNAPQVVLPPHSIEAEQSILAALMVKDLPEDNRAWSYVADKICAEDFYSDAHRRLFRHICALLESGRPAEFISLGDAIEAAGELEQCGGRAYFGEIADAFVSVASVPRHVEIVRQHSVMRQLQAICNQALADCAKPGGRSAAQIAEATVEALAQATASLAPRQNRWAADAIDIATLASAEIPEPVSLLGSNWLPQGAATLFHGDGGLGKSRHALRLAVCCATEQPWFDLPTMRMASVLYVSCEDGGDALHRRLAHTCRAVGVSLASLAGRLHLLDRHRRENTIWTERNGLTQDANEFGRYARDICAEFVVFDGLMDAFAGNVNDPAQAKAAVNAFLSILPAKCTLLIVGHVSKEAARNKLSEAAGTQGWNNSVRARWAMVADSDDSHIITLAKANEGPQGQQVKVRWSDEHGGHVGFLLTSDVRASLERGEERRLDDEVFDCVVDSIDRGLVVPAARTGSGTKAYDVLSASPKWRGTIPDTPAGRKRLYASLARLDAAGRLQRGSVPTSNRNTSTCYALPTGKASPV